MALTVEPTSSGDLLPPDPDTMPTLPGSPAPIPSRKPLLPEAEELFRGIYTRAGLTAPGVISGPIVLKTDHPLAGEVKIPVHIVVLDDHSAVRVAIGAILASEPDLELVGAAGSERQLGSDDGQGDGFPLGQGQHGVGV